jgi:hypothetical protein
MIKDYVPARSSLHTGLTIKSPMLERPKAKRTKAGIDEKYLSVDGDIKSGEIIANSIYTSGYSDGSDFYQGHLSGSEIYINRQFEIKNRNPYL